MLVGVCELFRGIPSFDELNDGENADTIAMRNTPGAYKKMLEVKEVILALDINDQVAGLLEWDERDRPDSLLAMITWLIVHPSRQGQGISSLLHKYLETVRIPDLIAKTRKPVYQTLGVHLKNPALNIYRKWDYVDAPFQYEDGRRLFMSKQRSTCTTETAS